jgi:hypothetical protein
VGRAIAAAFDAEPDNAFTTDDLCCRVYKSQWAAKRSERVAVLRAVKGLARHRPDLGVEAWKEDLARGKPVVFYRQYRVLSYAMARLKGDNFSFKRWQSEAELRGMLAPGGRQRHLIEPGGACLRHTEMAIAERDGDHAALERLEAEQEAVMGKASAHIQGALDKIAPARRRDGLTNSKEH